MPHGVPQKVVSVEYWEATPTTTVEEAQLASRSGDAVTVRLVIDKVRRTLALSLDGSVVLPGDDEYDDVRPLFNRRFDHLRPAAIARVAHAADVVECLAFARKEGVQVTIRSGGHSYEGWSSGDGHLVMDVGGLNAIAADSTTATIGAGLRLGPVYQELNARGRTIPAGTCPTVGVSGLTLGGGHGVLSRAYGLTCDNLLAATIVTADGSVRDCSGNSNPELFWALRGAGNGHFGVVTELRFTTHDAPSTITADLMWPWKDAATAITAWQDWAPELPDEHWSTLRLSRNGSDDPVVHATVVSLAATAELATAIDRLACAPTVLLSAQTWLDTVERYAGGELQTRPSYSARSAFVDRPLSTEAIATLIDGVMRSMQIHRCLDRTRRTGRRHQSRGSALDCVRPPSASRSHAERGVLDGGRGRPGRPSLAFSSPERVAAACIGLGLPELPRPGADRLASCLLRCGGWSPGSAKTAARPEPVVRPSTAALARSSRCKIMSRRPGYVQSSSRMALRRSSYSSAEINACCFRASSSGQAPRHHHLCDYTANGDDDGDNEEGHDLGRNHRAIVNRHARIVFDSREITRRLGCPPKSARRAGCRGGGQRTGGPW